MKENILQALDGMDYTEPTESEENTMEAKLKERNGLTDDLKK